MFVIKDSTGRAFHLMIKGRPYIMRCNVMHILQQKDISIKEFYNAIKISKNAAYSIIGNCYCMSFETAIKTAHFLGCKIDDLYSLEPIL